MRVKICGITRQEDAQFAEQEGADAIGVVLFSDSKRNVTPQRAAEIFASVGPFMTTVAVTHTTSRSALDRIFDISPSAIQVFIFGKSPIDILGLPGSHQGKAAASAASFPGS